MIKLYTLLLLGLLSVSFDGAQADDAAVAPAADPTQLFFNALANCTPGDYQEKNLLSVNFGPYWLNQKIFGVEQGACLAILTTPDNRELDCSFDLQDLSALSDQHFLDGILSMDMENPSKGSLFADQTWNDIKNQSCGFY